MKLAAASAGAGLSLLLGTSTSLAQSAAPVQLGWRAPANCPQQAQVEQKLGELLGASAADATPSRLRAEGQIEPIGERFRLTLNIHYDSVNGTRVVEGDSCEDLGRVAALMLALLFRAEHSSSAPLTARDLEPTLAPGAESGAGTADKPPPTPRPDQSSPEEQGRSAESGGASHSSWRFAFRAPELRVDLGVLPEPSYGVGLAAGIRHDAWRVLAASTFWLAQDYQSGPFLGYGAHFGRVSGELSACRGWQFSSFEVAPCLVLSLDGVSARGTGVGLSSTNPWTAFLSVGAGVQGLWQLNRGLALVLGVGGRVATSRPHFVSESVGEIAQVGPAALAFLLGCEWTL